MKLMLYSQLHMWHLTNTHSFYLAFFVVIVKLYNLDKAPYCWSLIHGRAGWLSSSFAWSLLCFGRLLAEATLFCIQHRHLSLFFHWIQHLVHFFWDVLGYVIPPLLPLFFRFLECTSDKPTSLLVWCLGSSVTLLPLVWSFGALLLQRNKSDHITLNFRLLGISEGATNWHLLLTLSLVLSP